MKKRNLLSSFSGGNTSAVMTKRLHDEYSDQFKIVTVFANTGQENEATLEFVRDFEINFRIPVVWVEAVINAGKRKGTRHRIVTFETAARDGNPFEDMIVKYGIPNTAFPHCTRELKLQPIKSYLASIGWKKKDYLSAVGIRTDERRRVSKKAGKNKILYPLIDMFPSDKQDVNDAVEDWPFKLNLPPYKGNCKWCWKKTDSKHVRLIHETPEIYDFPRRMESLYGFNGAGTEMGRRVFSGNRDQPIQCLSLRRSRKLPVLFRLMMMIIPDAVKAANCMKQ